MESIYRFYKDGKMDGTDKWSQVTIHELYRILEDLRVDEILCKQTDKRLKFFRDLKVNQLKTECAKRKLSSKGKKVQFYFD